MEKEGLVQGLNILMPENFDRLCSRCAHGKSHCLSLPETSTSQYSKMELVIMDLTGPMLIPTWDGNLYALVIVEAKCRYLVGQLLKQKEDVGKAMRDVVAMLEHQSGLKAHQF